MEKQDKNAKATEAEKKTSASETPEATDSETTTAKPKNNPQSLMMAVLLVIVAVGILVWSLNSIEDPLKRYRVAPTVGGKLR